MNDYTVFPNAPITEAILDIGVILPKGTEISTLKDLQEPIATRFPKIEEIRFLKGGVNVSEDKEIQALPSTSGIHGFRFRSSNQTKVVQSRLDGFTFNKLRPYENWEEFCIEARDLWNLYVPLAKPTKVVRIALRYVNRIEVPLPLNDFDEYLLTNPHVAPGLPQSLSKFFMRLEIPHQNIDSVAIITQMTAEQSQTDLLPLILDIDVITQADFSVDGEEIWEQFSKLRILKNDIFFSSTTDKAKELFK